MPHKSRSLAFRGGEFRAVLMEGAGIFRRLRRRNRGRFRPLRQQRVRPVSSLLMDEHAAVWVVAGPPGAGKTTVARILLAQLRPAPALLDKDTMYGSFVAATLDAAGRPPGEREGPWYDEHIKVHEYGGMTATAREIRAHGCPVVLSGPFTQQIHDLGRWRDWVKELGGDPLHLIWVRSDTETLRARLAARASARDTGKVSDFGAFTERMRLDREPEAPHHTVDNRLTAPAGLAGQVAGILARCPN
jgi:predicted kinase